jgi:hypothetical protein
MSKFDSAALLTVWEQGAMQQPFIRALKLLAVVRPEKSEEEWAQVSIGERDGNLLNLQEEWFGGDLEASTACTNCSEPLQFSFRTEDVRTPTSGVSDGHGVRISAAGYDLTCRLPKSADLLAVAQNPEKAASDTLLIRCVEEVSYQGAKLNSVEVSLPAEVVRAASMAMQRADQQAHVEISLQCPGCGNQWSQPFDIASYLWSEIEDLAQRLLVEIHILASNYGWSEREIMALSPRRRHLYAEMVGA